MTAAFRDPAVAPTTDAIRAALGTAAEAWDPLVELIDATGLTLAWRYYRDGGWLARVARGSRTAAWLNVVAGSARVTCYFAERDRAGLVDDTALSGDLRERIAGVALIGKLLPVSIDVRSPRDVAEVGTMLRIKLGTSSRARH